MTGSRVAAVSRDETLTTEVRRLAAVAGAEAEVVTSAVDARRVWRSAALVVVGTDVVEPLAQADLPRRPGVLVLTTRPPEPDLWQRALQLGAEQVAVLPDAARELVDRFAGLEDQDRPRGRIVAVIGGRGGAGASTFAAHLALAATAGGDRAVLVDADPLGGGLDLLLGVEDVAGARWGDLAGARGRVGAEALDAALPRLDAVGLLSCDREPGLVIPAEAMAPVLEAATRLARLTVVDLPRRLDAAAETALAAATVTVVVVPSELRATAAAAVVVAEIAPRCADVRLVVRGPAPGDLRPDDVAEALGLPLAGVVHTDRAVATAAEHGDRPQKRRSSVARVAAVLARAVLTAEAAAA